MYLHGLGVAQSQVQAVTWLRKAAHQDHADAQFNLGISYANRDGIPQDQSQAAAWFRKAAEQGHADAQFNLGLSYANGDGVPQDQSQAAAWYNKAAEQGHADAQFILGVAYANGEGVSQNDKQAVALYLKAAEQGQMYAQYNLGLMYRKGRGVLQDDQQAIVWYRKAAEQGFEDAITVLNEVSTITTRADNASPFLSTIQICSSGVWILVDSKVEIFLDGQLVGTGTIKTGFDVTVETYSGKHEIKVIIEYRALDKSRGTTHYSINIDAGIYQVTLTHNRFIGKYNPVCRLNQIVEA